jgi:hypothetical protein
MRLIQIEFDGTFTTVKYFSKDISYCAILFYTWGADLREITYCDTMYGAGYERMKGNKET